MDELEIFFDDLADELNGYLYQKLMNQYEYLISDEAIIETIEANEYEFTEDGERW